MLLRTSYKMKPPTSARLQNGHPLADKLVACYLLNEGSGIKAFDSSGRGKIVTIKGNVDWVPGKLGRCLGFPGQVGDYCSATIKSITGKLSFVCWFKLDSYVESAGLIDGGFETDYLFGFFTGKKVRFYVNGATNFAQSSKADFDTDIEWHQLAGTFDGETIKIYVDGREDGTGESTQYPNGRTTFEIGRYAGLFQMDGKIGNILIYNRALCASEIAWLYINPFLIFERRVWTRMLK